MPEPQASAHHDPVRQEVGETYAKALLGAAEKAQAAAQVVDELDSLVTDVLDELPKFESALMSPRLDEQAKVDLLDRVFASRAHPTLSNFLKVLARHNRLDCLREIARAARRLQDDREGIVAVTVRTAERLDAALQTQVKERLEQALGSQVRLTTAVEPALLGGLVIQIGDTVYDGSVQARLDRMRQATVQRAAEEIREQLERFLVPAQAG